MDKLKALIKVRDDHFLEHTHTILKEVYITLQCTSTFLTDNDALIAQATIVWEDVTLMDDMLIIMGTAEYKSGDVLVFGDNEYPITEENVDEFQQIVHMSIPYDLVLEGNTEKITEHLNAVGMGQPIEEFSDIFPPIHATPASDFDLSDLSESQLLSLKRVTSKTGH